MDNYSVSLAWSDEDGGYIALIPELNNVSAFGETAEEALAEVEVAAEAYLETCQAKGIPVPQPLKRPLYSGQLRLRMPATLHGSLATMAQNENVSLNQLIVSLVSEAYGYRRGVAACQVERNLQGSPAKVKPQVANAVGRRDRARSTRRRG
jgi:predicted RNase H-like HicB family nuclease